MEKTRIGISAGALGALVYFAGIFSGYTVCVLIAGYILLCEQNGWLRRCAVKALALMVCFSFVTAAVGLIPDLIEIIDDIAGLFDADFTVKVLTQLVALIVDIIAFAKIILFAVLGIRALSQRTIIISFLDSLISRHM